MKPAKPKAYSYIRFSTLKQKEEDRHSLPRQLEKAEKYATDHNLKLESLRDLGISGYSGAHIQHGELAKFLTWIKEGKIPQGSRLLIESIDRLTRLKPSDAQTLMIDILKSGVSLVVLDHGQREITLEKYNNDPGVFWQLMGEIQRAYQESNRKSERLTDARKRERMQARNGQRKISGMAPMWLELSKDKKEFIPIPEVVEVIHLIFQMKLNGKGTHRIEKELNQMDDIFVPTHKRNALNAWAKGTINRYLRDTRLIGEYQPHKYIKVEDEETGMEKRIRVIAGSVIPDYYPSVIDRSLFFQVQEILNANSNPEKGNHGGRNGEESNLFTYIATCGYCGSSLHYMNKGKWEYLQCESQRRGLGCTEHKPLRYDNGFEPFILKLCKELNPSDILPGDEQQQSRLAVLQNHLQSVNGELAGLEKEQKNLRDTIRRTTSSETRMLYDQDLQEIINKQGALKQQINQITEEINQIQTSTRDTRKRLEDIRELIDHMNNLKGKARIDLRIKLKLRLRQLIENISIKTGDQIQLAIQFTTDRELIYWIDQNGQVDVHDSEHSAEKQRESDSKVASALRKNKG